MILRDYLKRVLLGSRNYVEVKYQKKKDVNLLTENKTIVGAINEVNDSIKNVSPGMTEEQAQQLETNTNEISKIKGTIEQLKKDKGGLNATAKNLLITILRSGLYSVDQSENITKLETALGSSGGDEPIIPDEPDTPTVTKYTITNLFTNVTSDNNTTSIEENTSYTATLTPNEGHMLNSIIVIMGDEDITASVVANGVITIPSVTANVEITAIAIEEQQEATLIEDGLLAYVDGRTCTYNNSNSNGATTIIPNQGSGQFFAWAKDGVEVQDEYGLHFANPRNHMYDKDGGTNESDLGTQFTVVHLTKGHVGFGCSYSNEPPHWVFYPSYVDTSGSTKNITKHGNQYNSDSNVDYNFMVYRVDGSKLTQIMDTSRVDHDGTTINEFASWNAKVGMGMTQQNTDGYYVTAIAIYNRALSDVEIEEMRAFFKTLEVSA